MTSHTFSTYTFPSVQKPETISGYSWTVPDAKGAVFLVHGFRSHTLYNFLRNDSTDVHHQYGSVESCECGIQDSSLIREFNLRRLSVFGHDHVGHGKSSGERAYFDAFQILVDDLVAHIHLKDEEFQFKQNKIPIMLCAHSMGGTTAIATTIQYPDLVDAMALSSAATEPPANMFGVVGQIQYLLSAFTSIIIPKTVVVAMPKGLDPRLQAIYEADPLNQTIGVRARVGREMIIAYESISKSADQVKIPFLTGSGQNDTLVNPDAAQRFCDKASSTDKTYFPAHGRWHNLFVEDGYQEVHKMYADWLSERATKLVKTKG